MSPLIYSGIFISCCHFLRRTKAYIVYRHGTIRLASLNFKNSYPLPSWGKNVHIHFIPLPFLWCLSNIKKRYIFTEVLPGQGSVGTLSGCPPSKGAQQESFIVLNWLCCIKITDSSWKRDFLSDKHNVSLTAQPHRASFGHHKLCPLLVERTCGKYCRVRSKNTPNI